MKPSKKISTELLKRLTAQLTHYGLNPSDWLAQSAQNENDVRLVNRRDRNFQLIGSIERKRAGHAQWRGLHVASI